MAGRPRKPTALKIRDGDFEKNPQRQNHNEPTPETGIPRCPDHLPELAQEEWNRVCHELNSMGVLTLIERGALEQYCRTYAEWRMAAADLDANGRYTFNASGSRVENPAGKSLRSLSALCHKFLCEFGMTPASRTRLHIEKETQRDEAEEQIFGVA